MSIIEASGRRVTMLHMKAQVPSFTSNVIKIQLLETLYKYLGIRVVRVNSSIDWE